MPLDEMRFPAADRQIAALVRPGDIHAIRPNDPDYDGRSDVAAHPALPVELRRVETGGYVCDEDPGEACYGGSAPRGGIADDESVLLAALASGRVVLEIGTGLGVSTRAMAAPAKRVETVDTDPWVADRIAPGLPANAGFHRDRMTLAGMTGRFHLAFVDGEHTRGAVEADIAFCRSLLRPGGLIVLHDYRLDGVRLACSLSGETVHEVVSSYSLGLIVV